jgi:hypothetical protein
MHHFVCEERGRLLQRRLLEQLPKLILFIVIHGPDEKTCNDSQSCRKVCARRALFLKKETPRRQKQRGVNLDDLNQEIPADRL